MQENDTMVLTAEASACRAIAEHAEHCAFAAAALPPNAETVRWLAKQFAEIMDMAREGIDLPARHWHEEPPHAG